jgi:hypothetical protein
MAHALDNQIGRAGEHATAIAGRPKFRRAFEETDPSPNAFAETRNLETLMILLVPSRLLRRCFPPRSSSLIASAGCLAHTDRDTPAVQAALRLASTSCLR